MNAIHADTAREMSSGTSNSIDNHLNTIYRQIKKCINNNSNDKTLSISYLIPNGEFSLFDNQITTILKEQGYDVVAQKYTKTVPVMQSEGVLLIGW